MQTASRAERWGAPRVGKWNRQRVPRPFAARLFKRSNIAIAYSTVIHCAVVRCIKEGKNKERERGEERKEPNSLRGELNMRLKTIYARGVTHTHYSSSICTGSTIQCVVWRLRHFSDRWTICRIGTTQINRTGRRKTRAWIIGFGGEKKEKMNGVQKKRYRALFEYTSRLVFE
jgi:hypothetical protein